jgi:putative lipoprotein
VRGAVVYHRRKALPPGAKLEIVLEDVSLADAPAIRLAEQQIELGDLGSPIPFELRYDPALIDARHRYSVRGQISGGSGKLLYTSTTANQVISSDSPINGIDLLLSEVRSP